MNHRILVVEDDADMCLELQRMLARRGFSVVTRQRADEAFALLGAEDFDVIVTDLNMRGMNGIELCDRVVQNRRDVPVIVITGFGSMDAAIASIRAGAFDFLTKPFSAEQLALAVERAIRHRGLERELTRLREDASEKTRFDEIIGSSTSIQNVFDLIERVADSDATVLITAESGCGKELVARALHRRSRRSSGPMVAVNCAAVPESLLESELFGHARGAFTDAKVARKGLFLEASGGTLFLDELGEMPLGMQAKLLRALEERKVRPIGSSAEVEFDARIITATNRDLESLVAERRFREDLFYRVNVVHIEIPPLRSRGNDVLLLAQAFVERFAKRHHKNVKGISPEVAGRLLSYSWPGNVRELQNSLERAVALARFEELLVEDLPPKIRDYKSSHVIVAGIDPADLITLEEVERRYVARVMEAVQWNKTDATKVLGIDRSTLYRKLERYGLTAPETSGKAGDQA